MSSLTNTSIGIGTTSPTYSIDNQVTNGICRLTSTSTPIYGMQCGSATGGGNNYTNNVTFTNPFPNNNVYVIITPTNLDFDNYHAWVPTVYTITSTGFVWHANTITFNQPPGTFGSSYVAFNGSYNINWIAICYKS
jgi:hypothetical protein